MTSSSLYDTPAVWIVGVLFLAMLVAAEIGYRVARGWSDRTSEAARTNFGAIKAALLGLLALLVAFTYGMAGQRHELRQRLVLEEANALHKLMLYADMLTEARRVEFHKLLKEYVEVRLAYFYARRDTTKVTEALTGTEKLDEDMWRVLRSEMQNVGRAPVLEHAMSALVESWSLQRERLVALENRIPDPVLWLLFSATIAGMAVVGVGSGLSGQRATVGGTLLAALLCGTIYVVLDLDRPRRGIFQTSQTPMLQLKEALERGRAADLPTTR